MGHPGGCGTPFCAEIRQAVLWVGKNIEDLNDLAFQRDPSGERSPPRRSKISRNFRNVIGREAIMRENNGFRPLQTMNRSHIGVAKLGRRMRERIEDGL